MPLWPSLLCMDLPVSHVFSPQQPQHCCCLTHIHYPLCLSRASSSSSIDTRMAYGLLSAQWCANLPALQKVTIIRRSSPSRYFRLSQNCSIGVHNFLTLWRLVGGLSTNLTVGVFGHGLHRQICQITWYTSVGWLDAI